MRGAQSYGRFQPSSEGLAGIPGEKQPLAQRCEASPISRRNCSRDSGFPFPAVARRTAVNNRLAFFGALRRWEVSITRASSSAGTIATLLSPLRRTMTISWSLATRSSTEAKLWRRLVYVVSVTFNLLFKGTGLLSILQSSALQSFREFSICPPRPSSCSATSLRASPAELLRAREGRRRRGHHQVQGCM